MSIRVTLACFGAVQHNRVLAGITPGIVAASATAGALLGFGIHLGAPARPFNAIAGILLGAAATRLSGFAPATIVGILVHAAAIVAAGLLYGTLVARSSGHPVRWALVVSAGGVAVTEILARPFGVGPAVVLPVGNVLAVGVVLAVALVMGMRLALSRVYKG